MNASNEVFERDRSRIFGKGEGQADVVNRRKDMKLHQSDSHKMKSMLMNGAALRNGMNAQTRPVNPIWSNFPTRCVRPILTTEELKKKLEYFTHSDEVMVVRYHREGCTACNALDKTFEFLCHESAVPFPKLHFYDINRDEVPQEMTKGLVRFPQVKGYSSGQWVDLDFKPSAEFREELYMGVEREVRARANDGVPVTAVQAEEMYFSAAGPSMLMVLEENLTQWYMKSQTRLHNYWKQVSVRRSWFYKKFVEPTVDEEVREDWRTKSVFGEAVKYGPELDREV
ncbi:Hypothetical protein, putative [Bodo saltans]|uniref:Thioredoxin-like protein n=1 Tax=Bodo saltans TaxID=75058 RepID=A0A0S4ITS5_BODSA|nr:Hypothetical protein, putative [Bodo saltans]|eukprot:CUF78932.1 Hypothetical protein, putative [Bodo saltans]